MKERLRAGIVFAAGVWLACAPGVAPAQQAAPAPEAGIWIADASGELRRVEPSAGTFLRGSAPPPEGIGVVLAVETHGQTASGALAAGDLAVARVTRAVAGFGAGGVEVRREPPVVRPRFEHRLLAASWEEPRLLGYDAAQIIHLRTTRPQRLGLLIDLAVGAGATRVLDVLPGRSGP